MAILNCPPVIVAFIQTFDITLMIHQMADRKTFLLRIDPVILAAMQRWADDDIRSLNAQIEFVLRRSLITHKRMKAPDAPDKN